MRIDLPLTPRSIALMILLSTVVATQSRPAVGQSVSASLAAEAGESSKASIANQVLGRLRDRDVSGALASLATKIDDSVTMQDLVMSDLPSAAGGLHRSLSQLSSDEQYDLLEKWTLGDGDGRDARMLAVPVPTDAPPKVFARSIGERPRDTTFAVASVGPVPGFFCSGWMFVRAADDLGRLSRLRVTLEEKSESETAGTRALLMLAHLAGSRGQLDRVRDYLQERVAAGAGDPQMTPLELSTEDVVSAAIASAALLHPELQSVAQDYLQQLVDRGEVGKAILLRPFLRIAHATAVQVHLGESSPEVLFRNRLKDWIPSTIRTSRELTSGQPGGVWLTHEQHVLHLAGGTTDILFYRYPLRGPFDFICETQEGGDIGTDGGLVYGGLHFQALGRKDSLTVWDPDKNHMITRASPFARHGSGPVFNRVSIRSSKDGFQFESNFHPVWFDGASATASPWIGLRSSGTKRPVFRNLRIVGQPIIPREVLLTEGDQLRGWQSGFYGESQPPFRSDVDSSASEWNGSASAEFDWQLVSGELLGAARSDSSEVVESGLLQYQRPLQSDESVTYQFLHDGEASTVHPALGRLAFLLEPTGVRVRWITTGETDWSGLAHDNAALEPLSRRGPRPLPLQEGKWNAVRLELSGGKSLVSLNGELVYERPLDFDGETQFGLYRPSRTKAVRVRAVTLSGDWPEQIPPGFADDPLALVEPSEPSRRN